ncbi:anti-sigma factor [Streptomyces sp. NPDC015130]|uniref:anti-sigma factor n=1 Tax=Streptomyces sp. NPDC015130 TaxID=3364940 RepID=UPI0036FBB7C8
MAEYAATAARLASATAQDPPQLDDVSTVLAAPDARTAHGRATNGALTTVVSSDRQNQAVFTATGLPTPAQGKTYQLWLDQDGTMQPAGFIHSDGTVPLHGDPADATAVGRTLEPTGGSPQPTTTPLLLMALPACRHFLGSEPTARVRQSRRPRAVVVPISSSCGRSSGGCCGPGRGGSRTATLDGRRGRGC